MPGDIFVADIKEQNDISFNTFFHICVMHGVTSHYQLCMVDNASLDRFHDRIESHSKPPFAEVQNLKVFRDHKSIKRAYAERNCPAFPELADFVEFQRRDEQVFTVVLVGATGAGKTSLLNLFHGFKHWVSDLGTAAVEKVAQDPLVKPLSQREQGTSKTSGATLYSCELIPADHQLKVPALCINVLDTAGFASTKQDVQEDNRTEKALIHELNKEGGLNCVVTCMKASDNRELNYLTYVYSRLASILPIDHARQAHVVLTHGPRALVANTSMAERFVMELNNNADPNRSISVLENPFVHAWRAIREEGTLPDPRQRSDIQDGVKQFVDFLRKIRFHTRIPTSQFKSMSENREKIVNEINQIHQRMSMHSEPPRRTMKDRIMGLFKDQIMGRHCWTDPSTGRSDDMAKLLSNLKAQLTEYHRQSVPGALRRRIESELFFMESQLRHSYDLGIKHQLKQMIQELKDKRDVLLRADSSPSSSSSSSSLFRRAQSLLY